MRATRSYTTSWDLTVASAFGTSQTLIASGAINIAAAIGVLLVPSVRRIRSLGTTAAANDDDVRGPLTEMI